MTNDITFHLIKNPDLEVIVVIDAKNGRSEQANSNHPYWDEIVDGAWNSDPEVFDYFNLPKTLAEKMMVLSDRVSYDHDTVYFDGDPTMGPLADHLMRTVRAGDRDVAPIVAFWEKLASNPDKRSRDLLFDWLAAHEFSITPDGDIVGYKGLSYEGKSTRAGEGRVEAADGTVTEYTNDYLPNEDGSVVSMPRSKVDSDPNSSCSTGLHIGTWSFARGFSAHVVKEVHVNPRDVVSIPHDSSSEKMRACRYKVIGAVNAPHGDPIVR